VLDLPDFVRAPNQAGNPAAYEIENAAVDHEGTLAAALSAAAKWEQRDLLDLGCGAGYWLPVYSEHARSVIGVEPDTSLLPAATARPGHARVLHGSAEHIPLPDACVDVVHARFSYFFPPGCDAGLAEVMRVLRPGGTLVVIDNDHRWGQFAGLLAASQWAAPQGSAEVTDRWWAERGAQRQEVQSSWQFRSREDLETALRLEFPPDVATRWLNEHRAATGLTYGYVLFAISSAA
jgi:ubiquinone/menaquinone biosynthesis C-methylase UbiE